MRDTRRALHSHEMEIQEAIERPRFVCGTLRGGADPRGDGAALGS